MVQRLPAVCLREVDFDAGNIAEDRSISDPVTVAHIAGVEGAGTAVGAACGGHAGAGGIKAADGGKLCTGQRTDHQTGACAVVNGRFARGLLIEGIGNGKISLIQGGADIAAKHKGHLRPGSVVESVADKGGDRRLDVGTNKQSFLPTDVSFVPAF